MSSPETSSAAELLDSLEHRAAAADHPDQKARILNLAGDLAFDAGERERALAYYGAAIDVLLQARHYDGAAAACRKIVQLTPEVVRARCTLAWIALSRGLLEEARERVLEYADAASDAGRDRMARGHLRMMAEVTESQPVLEAVAEGLLRLGDFRAADRVFGAAFAGTPPWRWLPEDPAARWEIVLERITEGTAPRG